jgi:hypothetical protein
MALALPQVTQVRCTSSPSDDVNKHQPVFQVFTDAAPVEKEKPAILFAQYAKDHNIDVRDMEQYVRRGTAQRIKEKEAKGDRDGRRPQNAFVLYRTAYQHVVGLACNEVKQNNISVEVGKSWHCETHEVKERFRALADIEKVEHALAFGVKKYNPKKKQADGKRSLADRKASGSKRAKASRTADLRAPPRSPEPSYYRIEGTPSAEVPSLSSYQGTPMTSSVPTPQLGYAQPYYAQPFEASFDQGACYSQAPYGRAQIGGQLLFNPVTQETALDAGSPPIGASLYPELPEPMAAAPPPYYTYVNPGAYQQYPMQILAQGVGHMPVMGAVQQPQPVLRQIVPDTGGVMDPRALAIPMVDPILFEDSAQDIPDAVSQLIADSQDATAFEQAADHDYDYLRYDEWTEDTFA